MPATASLGDRYRRGARLLKRSIRYRLRALIEFIGVGLELIEHLYDRKFLDEQGLTRKQAAIARDLAYSWLKVRGDRELPLAVENLPREWGTVGLKAIADAGRERKGARRAENESRGLSPGDNSHGAERLITPVQPQEMQAPPTAQAVGAPPHPAPGEAGPNWSSLEMPPSSPFDAWVEASKLVMKAREIVEGIEDAEAREVYLAELRRLLDSATPKSGVARPVPDAPLAVGVPAEGDPDMGILGPKAQAYIESQGLKHLPTPRRNVATSRGSDYEATGAEWRPSLPNLCDGCPTPYLPARMLGVPADAVALGATDPEHPNCVALVVRAPEGARPLRVISACSGIGVLAYAVALAARDEGERADFLAAADPWWFAREVHDMWFSDTPVLGDLRLPSVQHELCRIAGEGTDVLVLSPPCTGYSTARVGKREGKVVRHGGVLHPEYLDVLPTVDSTRPKGILLENVPGYERDPGFAGLVEGLRARGYVVMWDTLDALPWGAVHERERLFLIAVRRDLAPVVLDAPVDPHILEMPDENFRHAPIPDHLLRATKNPHEIEWSKALGGAVVVPMARAVARHMIRLLLGRDSIPRV